MGRMLDAIRKIEASRAERRGCQPLEDAGERSAAGQESPPAKAERPVEAVIRESLEEDAGEPEAIADAAAPACCDSCSVEAGTTDPVQTAIETVAEGDADDRPRTADAPAEAVGDGDQGSALVADVEVGAVAGANDLAPLVWPDEPGEEHARACRRLARNLLGQVPPSGGTVLLFTSATGGEGKTELLVALAAALAKQAGDDVLLIDGDLKAVRDGGGRTQKTWRSGQEAVGASGARVAIPQETDNSAQSGDRKTEGSPGFAGVLAGTADWREVVQTTTVPHLAVLPGGATSGGGFGPSDQLRLRSLLEQIRRRYRLILIDAASLAEAEAAAMAACCDGVYLVVRLGHNTTGELARAVAVLDDCGSRLLGSVVVG